MFDKIKFLLQKVNVNYRPNTKITSKFGFTNRYKIFEKRDKDDNLIKDKNGKPEYEIIWGYPGIHPGIDHAGDNDVIAPFGFGRSSFQDLKGIGYGSILSLFHNLNFVIRICHMYPDELAISKSGPVKKNTYIGGAGSYGFSTGRHTHSECEAWGYKGKWFETCQVLDEFLKYKYGKDINKPLTRQDILLVYNNSEHTKKWNAKKCFSDYNNIIVNKKIEFINKYKIIYKRGKLLTTYYSLKYIL